MINRLFIKNLLSFEDLDLEFLGGLVVFTGPSGAGKSLLVSSILSSFGHETSLVANLCELNLTKPKNFDLDGFDLDDELVIKTIKKEKTRFYLDSQNISKKLLKNSFTPFVRHLSVRDKDSLNSNYLIGLLDSLLIGESKEFKKLTKEFKKRYTTFNLKKQELEEIKSVESNLAQKIEYIKYEIEKIEKISPKVGEYEDILETKKHLSKIDKLNESIDTAKGIFNFEASVEEVYRLLDKDSSEFGDTMNRLRADFEDIDILTHKLEDVEIEEVLDRLSDITSLINLYGSVEASLEYQETKQQELNSYGNIEKDKSFLESFIEMEYVELFNLSNKISKLREQRALKLSDDISLELKELKMPSIKFEFTQKDMALDGIDIMDVSLNGSSLNTLSGGEFNRLRLAFMTQESKGDNGGILILDEIDANVSGEESIAIADMISRLSENYQVFVISHQPHIASKASQHILVNKENNSSYVKELYGEDRVEEIARIVAGDKLNNEAIEFAKKLLG